MNVRVHFYSSLMKNKSNLAAAQSAGWKYLAGYRYDQVRESVIIAVEFVVRDVIDPGCGDFLPRGKLSAFARQIGPILGLQPANAFDEIATKGCNSHRLEKFAPLRLLHGFQFLSRPYERPEFFYFARLADDHSQSIRNYCNLGVSALEFIRAAECLVEGFGMFHVHSCHDLGLNEIGYQDHVVTT
jgi:hypothetical protein